MNQHTVHIGSVALGHNLPLALISGPCVIESREMCLRIAESALGICEKLSVPYVFKASYDKANRTSINSFRGPGRDEGLRILEEVRKAFNVPVLSDVHWPEDCAPAGEALDAIQIPAFLARQTDLLVAAARTGKPVNVKKAQFMAPQDMGNVCGKLRESGNDRIILTERGSSFGYHNLVADMRSIPLMQSFGCPVVFDATHSVQRPAGQGDRSGGDRELAGPLALAAVAAGADGLFIETHPEPEKGLSDAATMLPLSELEGLLAKAVRIREVVLG